MLKRRVILTLTFLDGVLHRTKRFHPDYRYTQNFVGSNSADELFVIHLGGERKRFYKEVRALMDRCFVPVTVGGGIDALETISFLMSDFGADKVVMNSALHRNPGLIDQIAHKFGSQVLSVGIDCAGDACWYDSGKCKAIRPLDWAKEVESRGAGEIFLQDITLDGSLQGYNLALLEEVVGVSIPVVIGSGCGKPDHMVEAFKLGASGAATSCIHHFPEGALKGAKDYLRRQGMDVRP